MMRHIDTLTFGPFRLDLNLNALWHADTPIPLRSRAFEVLRYFTEHPQRLIPPEEFVEHVWEGRRVSRSVVRVCIHEIRMALGDTAESPQYVETVGRQGYRFRVRPLVHGAPPRYFATGLGHGPVVGRQSELDQLQQGLDQGRQGQRQVIWISGEPGIGKTTVMDAFVADLGADPDIRIGRGQCIEHAGAGEAFLPVFEALGRLGQAPGGEAVCAVLRRVAPSALAHLPVLVPESEREALRRQVEGVTRTRLLRELAEALEALAATRPLVWVLEDLHWSDPSTIDFLAYLAKRRDPAQLLVLGTYRPTEAQGHPLMGLLQEMQGHGQGVELRLSGLTPADLSTYVTERLGGALSPSTAALLHERSGGNPLFLVHLVEHLVQEGLMIPEADEWILLDEVGARRVLPEGVRQLLAKQCEQLPVASQRALEAASVVGERFAVAAVAAGAPHEVASVDAVCADVARTSWLLEAGALVAWPDGTVSGEYRFAHALVRQVIYERLAAGQRMALHRRIGLRLEAGYRTRSGEIAVVLTVHFLHGQDPLRAVRYLSQAAENASNRSAHREAIAHCHTALEILPSLPDASVRTDHEVDLLLALRHASVATKGYMAPEITDMLSRLQELCEEKEENPHRLDVLRGQLTDHMMRAEIPLAHEAAERQLHLVQRQNDPVKLAVAHYDLGCMYYWGGAFVQARHEMELALGLRQAHLLDPGRTESFMVNHDVMCRAWLSWICSCLGDQDQALAYSRDAVRRAQKLDHPYTLTQTLSCASSLHLRRREIKAAHEITETMLELARQEGFSFFVVVGRLYQAWELILEGQSHDGIALMRKSLATQRQMANIGQTAITLQIAEAYWQSGNIGEGLAVIQEVREMIEHTGERFYEAELYRLEGELHLVEFPRQEAEAIRCLHKALAIARLQQAKLWELRAAMSLSRLWQWQGRHDAAHRMLSEVYHGLSEGFDTPDMRDAKELLAELERA